MLKAITLTTAVLASIAAASAADLPVKAPPKASNPFINYAGSGVYWFAGAFGGATTVDATSGANGAKLSATGAGVSGGAGWMWGRTTTWIAADARVNYATTSVDALCGIGTACSFKQNFSLEGRVKYGSDSSTLANWLPNLGLSALFDVLPVVGAVTPSHPYVFAYGEVGRDRTAVLALGRTQWRGEYGGGVGMVHQIGPNKALDTWAKCGIDPGSQTVIGAANFKLGTTCKGGLDLIF